MTGQVKVNDRVWRGVLKRVSEMKRGTVRVGVMGDAGDENGVSLAEIAAFHEFGTSTIPERSFLRSTFYGHAAEGLRMMCEKLSKAIVEGKLDEPRALGLLGTWAVAEVKKTIVNRQTTGPEDQALAAATIAAKGSSLPLVDTGQLINSITYVVEK